MGYENYIFRFFSNFLTLNDKNDHICIQTVEFIFKRSNLNSNKPIRNWQCTTAHRLEWQTVPPNPDRHYLYRPCRPPRHFQQAIPPSKLALPLGTNLILSTVHMIQPSLLMRFCKTPLRSAFGMGHVA
jgi:hypothetical protein